MTLAGMFKMLATLREAGDAEDLILIYDASTGEAGRITLRQLADKLKNLEGADDDDGSRYEEYK